ncbi:MAG: hypothetical protein U9Q62_04780 [Campylobacterota bacterium]|nr:hypothetical protein [Campylobacterota bacterium]
MGQINWDQFKEYKQSRENPEKLDNFQMLLEFIRSFYNKQSTFEIFDTLVEDELSRMMMEKRNISEPEHLEEYLFKVLRS